MEQKEEESSKLMNDFIKLEDLRITHNTCISEVRLQKEKDARSIWTRCEDVCCIYKK